MAKDVVINFKSKGVDKLGKDVEDLNKGLDKTAESAKDVSDNVDDIGKSGAGAKKGLAAVSTGFKGIGTAIKAAGIGIVIGLFAALKEILEQQQPVLDLVDTTMTAIGLAINAVGDALGDAFDSANDATGGFDALGKVMDGILTLVLTPFKLTFYEIQGALLAAQLAWETSPFGNDDPKEVKRLKEELIGVKDNIIEVGEKAIEAGKQVIDNFAEAVGEVGTFAESAIDNIAKIDAASIISEAKRTTDLKNNAAIREAINQGLLEQYDREAEKLRQVRDDDTAAITDRIKANQDLGKVLEEQEKVMTANAKQVTAAAQATFNANKTTENRVALIQAQNEEMAILATVEGFRSEQLVNQNALLKEQAEIEAEKVAKTKEESERLEAQRKEERERLEAERIADETAMADRKVLEAEGFDAELQAERDKLALHYKNLLADEDLSEEQRLLLQAKYDKESAALDEKSLAHYKAIQAAKIASAFDSADSLMSISNSINALAGENAKFGKVLAVGQIALDTAKGVSGAIAAGAGIPFPGNIPAILSGVAAVVGGMVSAKNALKSAPAIPGAPDVALPNIPTPSVGGGGGGSFAAPAIDQGAVFAPQQLFGQEAEQIGSGAGFNQVVVLESDITTTQKKVQTAESTATFG